MKLVALSLCLLITACNMRYSRLVSPTYSDTGEDSPLNRQLAPSHECAVISGLYFHNQSICYSTSPDGLALFEGDIVLGRALDLKSAGRGVVARVGPSNYRWEGAVVPYTIEDAFPDTSRIITAIDHFHLRTRVRFVPRENQTDYVTFRRWAGCSSAVGRMGGQQFVNIGTGCSTGSVIHELMHVLGFWHEHSRKDRDQYVKIHWENILTGWEHNFNQQINDSDTHQPYDYESIMHYLADSYTNGNGKTISRLDNGEQIGQLVALSTADMTGIEQLYFSPLDFNQYTSWNPLDKHSSFNLTMKNLTAKATSIPLYSSPLVRATNGKSRGKFYFEITLDDNGYHSHNNSQPITHMACVLVGLLTMGPVTLSSDEPRGCLYKDDVGNYQTGEIRCIGNEEPFALSAEILEAGDILGIAADLDRPAIYYNRNGVWRAGNPRQLTGGIPLPGSGLTYYPAIASECNNASGQVTANFGQHPFRYPVPPNFMPGWKK